MTLYTSKVVAQWLCLTERRVRQLRDEGVIVEARPGLYELQPTVARYEKTTIKRKRILPRCSISVRRHIPAMKAERSTFPAPRSFVLHGFIMSVPIICSD